MGDKSSIEWTEATWNPTTGCDRISWGCDHCYALTLAKRLKAMGAAKYQTDGDPRTSGPGFGVAVHPDQKAAERFPKMRQEARARRRDRKEQESGSNALFTHEELVRDAPLRVHESYQHNPPVPPYGQIVQDPGY